MIKILVFLVVMFSNLFALSEYEEGKIIFEKKCSSCHVDYIPINKLKENFFFKDNKLLNLRVPTVNMLAYAIIDGPKKIGNKDDEDMRQIEIEEFLKSYLEKPDPLNSICDDHIKKYYDKKEPIKDLSDDDYVNLSYFFLEYDKNDTHKKKLVKSNIDEKSVIKKAKKENKLIMVYATSSTCYFCKKMEKNVLSHKDIKKQIDENYIYIKINMDENSLPFSLQEKYKKITPSFFVLDKKGQFITQYPGSWTKKDFKLILKENIKK